MKLCYIADAGCIHTQRWVNYFAQRGHDVHLISFRSGEGYPKSVRFYKLTLLTKLWAISRYINWLIWFMQVRRLVSKIKPDIIEGQEIIAYGHLAIASGFRPAVLTALGSDILISPKLKRLYWFLNKYALRKAAIVICNSETVKKELLKLGVESTRIRMIYNGIETQKFNPQRGQGFRDRLGIPEGPVVVSTRNFKPVYNVEMLIRAVPLVLEQEPQTRFMIISDGEQRDYLNRLVISLGISNSISFLGRVEHDELPDFLAAADIYVSTSLSDGTSLSLQEAMACELPPVVTDLPANREWLTDGENGFIVPVNDVTALAERIVYLIRNKEVRAKFGKAGREIIKQKAEYEKEMSKMETIYQEQIQGKKS